MEEAERIAREEHGSRKLAVISGTSAPRSQPGASMVAVLTARQAERAQRRWIFAVRGVGVGTRHYYRKLGFELEGPYMVKTN